VGFGCDDARKDGSALVVKVHGGYKLRRQPRWGGVGRRGVLDGGKGVGKDRAVGGGEGFDEGSRVGLVERGPCGGADAPPEAVIGAETAEVVGGGGCGGESGTVEAIKDVGLNDVGVEDGDVGRRRRSGVHGWHEKRLRIVSLKYLVGWL